MKHCEVWKWAIKQHHMNIEHSVAYNTCTCTHMVKLLMKCSVLSILDVFNDDYIPTRSINIKINGSRCLVGRTGLVMCTTFALRFCINVKPSALILFARNAITQGWWWVRAIRCAGVTQMQWGVRACRENVVCREEREWRAHQVSAWGAARSWAHMHAIGHSSSSSWSEQIYIRI